jgi:hypothetical protein
MGCATAVLFALAWAPVAGSVPTDRLTVRDVRSSSRQAGRRARHRISMSHRPHSLDPPILS